MKLQGKTTFAESERAKMIYLKLGDVYMKNNQHEKAMETFQVPRSFVSFNIQGCVCQKKDKLTYSGVHGRFIFGPKFWFWCNIFL